MKKSPFIAILFFLFLVTQAHAVEFNCWMPPFGADLQDLNKNGEFVKYKEIGEISYYNYTGPCKFELHKHTTPTVAFAFVDEKLYARLLSFPSPDELGKVSMKALLDEGDISMKTLQNKDGSAPKIDTKEYKDGDWEVVQIVNQGDDRITKIKFNRKLRVIKSAVYSKPIHDMLTQNCSDSSGCELIFD